MLNYAWDRTARDELSPERFTKLEKLVKDFMIEQPDAVPMAIAAARAGCEDPGLAEVFEILRPVLKSYAATKGIELVDYDPSPY